MLVERYLCDTSPQGLAQLAAETRAAVAALAAQGIAIAYLGSTAIPDEETCFCVFAADSPVAVELVNACITAPCVRIIDALAV